MKHQFKENSCQKICFKRRGCFLNKHFKLFDFSVGNFSQGNGRGGGRFILGDEFGEE